MPLTLLQNVNFGQKRSGLTGSFSPGYTVLNVAGGVVTPRTAVGVYEVMSGVYAANVTFPDSFNGQILWDCPATGSLSASFAAEQQNVQANDPKVADTWNMVSSVTGSIQGLYDVAFGRWKIDKVANTMTFYRTDNVTVVAVFNLLDDTGSPTFDGVFERQLTGTVTP